MCVIKLHAFIYFLRPPPWSGTIPMTHNSMPYCHTAHYLLTSVYHYLTIHVPLPHYSLSDCATASLSHCRAIPLSHCPISSLSHCPTIALPHCPIRSLSHCLTAPSTLVPRLKRNINFFQNVRSTASSPLLFSNNCSGVANSELILIVAD